jgi:membrane-bound ClpP family serine protease
VCRFAERPSAVQNGVAAGYGLRCARLGYWPRCRPPCRPPSARYSQRRKEVSLLTLGVVLLALGAVLLVAEAHLPSFGALGVAGIAALVTGAALAVDAASGGVALVLAVAVAIGLGGAALLLFAVRATLPVARARARTGAEALVGNIGVVRQAPAPIGQILVDGALWRARPCWEDEDGPSLRVGDHVVVERVNGLTLSVRRAEEWELEP